MQLGRFHHLGGSLVFRNAPLAGSVCGGVRRLCHFGLLPLLLLRAQSPVLHSDVPLVMLPTSVSDRGGHALTGLQASDFSLEVDGRPVPIQVEASDEVSAPLSIVTLIQTSDISLSALHKIQKTGAVLSQAVVGVNGEAAILTYDSEVRLLQDFTNDANAISTAFYQLRPAEDRGGRLLDAISRALEMLEGRPGPRRAAIVIIGESRDRGSNSRLSDLLRSLQRSPVTVFSLTYSAYLTPFTTKASEYTPPDGGSLLTVLQETTRLAKQNAVKVLTETTGGRQFRFETKSKLENDLIGLGEDIHSRYLISFTPPAGEAPGFHRLELHVREVPEALIHTGWATGSRKAIFPGLILIC